MTHSKKLAVQKQKKQVYLSPLQGYKDPWLAVNLSMFFPGLGQLYAGKVLRGLIWLITQVFLIIYACWSIFAAEGQTMTGLLCLSLAVSLYLGNILDAHLCVYYQYQSQIGEKIPRKRKNPWFGMFASRILPGLGHFYNQQSFTGLFFLSTALVFLQLENKFSTFLIVPPTLTAIATYHAYITFPYSQDKFHLSQRSLMAIMVGLIFIWGLISPQIPNWIDQKLELFVIPSESMQPTLEVNDRVFVQESVSYKPQRGEIVVFQPSETIKAIDPQPGDFYIKRVIATPGEKVAISQGIVYINEQPLQEDYIAELPNYDLAGVIVPPNCYFMLGDNRNNSFDSHIWGFLPQEDIFGRAYKVYWPSERVKSLIADN
jgi:signal peptidase I